MLAQAEKRLKVVLPNQVIKQIKRFEVINYGCGEGNKEYIKMLKDKKR